MSQEKFPQTLLGRIKKTVLNITGSYFTTTAAADAKALRNLAEAERDLQATLKAKIERSPTAQKVAEVAVDQLLNSDSALGKIRGVVASVQALGSQTIDKIQSLTGSTRGRH